MGWESWPDDTIYRVVINQEGMYSILLRRA